MTSQLASPRRQLKGPGIAYIGWIGHKNLGDEAIYEALQGQLPGRRFESVPLWPRELLDASRSRRVRALRRSTLLLGGGTVLGRSYWRYHLWTALALVPTRPAFMIGAGVEDPAFKGVGSPGNSRELRRWPAIFRRFHAVTVRGYRSQALLADQGIDSRVVGDPGLLLTAAPDSEVSPGLIGVNLGFGDDLFGHDHGAVVTEAAAMCRKLLAAGRQVRFLVANPADMPPLGHCLSLIGDHAGVEVIDCSAPTTYMRAVAECEVVVAERLHAAVLACAAHVPTISLAYQPKCFDFMSSVDRQEWCVRTDQVSAEDLVSRVEALSARRTSESVGLKANVERMRVTLRSELETIQRLTGA
jgi:polysaccharide pyruvyl transferase WcaK-like protein